MLLAEQMVGEARASTRAEVGDRERLGTGVSASSLPGVALASPARPSERTADPVLTIAACCSATRLVSCTYGSSSPTTTAGRSNSSSSPCCASPRCRWFRCWWRPDRPSRYCPISSATPGIGTQALARSAIAGLSIRRVLVLGRVRYRAIPHMADVADLRACHRRAARQRLHLDRSSATTCWTTSRSRIRGSSSAAPPASTPILTPVAFVIAIAAADEPLTLLAIGPLVWLLQVFSEDRRERYAATLELNRAYRGIVMLLSDVVEFDDKYTARALALGRRPGARGGRRAGPRAQPTGRSSSSPRCSTTWARSRSPRRSCNKPAKLTAKEFEVMKNHTIEGQFMLDRVGGCSAGSARSCAPVTSAGTEPVTRTDCAASEIPLAVTSRLRVRRLQRDDERSRLSRRDDARQAARPSSR